MSSAETFLKKSIEKVGNAPRTIAEAPKKLISGKAPSENSDRSVEHGKNQSDGSLTKSTSDDPTTSSSGSSLKKSLEKVGQATKAIAEAPKKLVPGSKSTNDDAEDDYDKFCTVETDDDSDDEIDVHKYSCAFLPKAGGVLQRGSFVVTTPFLYFIGSRGSRYRWIWDDITAKLSKTFGAVANSITIVYTGEDEEHPTSYKFVLAPGVRKKAFARISEFASIEDIDGDCSLSEVSDETLNKMDITVKKYMKGVSIKDFLEAFLERRKGTNETPIYEEFLIADGRENIQVNDFVTAEDGKEFVGDWCGEKYQRKRTVTYTFKKHGYEGNATVTQYVRVEGDDKVVIQGTTAVTGPPYSDHMVVHHRSVARIVGGENVSVLAGVFVEFVKSTMLEGKIRAISMAETTKTHLHLYELGKKYCYERLGAEDVTCMKSRGIQDDAMVTTGVPYYGLLAFVSGLLALFYQLMADITGKPRPAQKLKEGAIYKDINSGQAKLNKIAKLADEMDDETISGEEKKIRPHLKVVHQCLDKVLDQLLKSEAVTPAE